jgi:ABC-type sulfate transport system substrate-binding protein
MRVDACRETHDEATTQAILVAWPMQAAAEDMPIDDNTYDVVRSIAVPLSWLCDAFACEWCGVHGE